MLYYFDVFCRFVDVNMWLIFKTGQMALAALQHNNSEVGNFSLTAVEQISRVFGDN